MFKFNKEIESIFKTIAQNADNMGVSAYFVGGMVRDILMGIKIKDIDILIEGSAIDFVHKFAGEFTGFDTKIKSVHKDFNTAKTVINGIEIDFASTREDEYPKSGCLPVVRNVGCPVEKDLKRRDFTVNAIAAKLLTDENGLKYELIDLFNGKDDIKACTLKVLHNKSYIDDPTRILRGLDFILRFGFDFSDEDKNLINEYLKSSDREGLSIDRVKLTLKKLFFCKERAKKAYQYILENKLYKIWQDTPFFQLEWADRLADSVEIFNLKAEDVFTGAIFEDFSAGKSYKPLLRGVSNYEIYNFYKNFKPVDLALQYAVSGDKNIIFYFQKLKDIKPDITGDDLLKQGFTPGKALGAELSRRLKTKLNSIKRK